MRGTYEVMAKRERELVDPLHVVNENQRRTDHAKRTMRGLENPQRLKRSRFLPSVAQEQRLQPARSRRSGECQQRSEAAASGTSRSGSCPTTRNRFDSGARPAASANNRLFPLPGCPTTTAAATWPAVGAPATSPSSASSSRRPTNALICQSVRRVQKRGNGLRLAEQELVSRMDDREELEIDPGDVLQVPPGHDAWIVGDEPYVGLDFKGGAEYAKT